MPSKNQEQLWKAIQRDATAAGITPGAFLAQNPERYTAYQQAGAKTSPLHNNPNHRVINEEARETAKTKGISEAAALVDLFGRDQEGRARYDQWRAERDKLLNPKVGGGVDGGAIGPLTTAEMLKLQADAKALGTELTLGELARAGWVNARALMADIADGTLVDDVDDHEFYGEPVRFTDLNGLP